MKILLITTTYPTPVRPHQGAFNRTLVAALRADHDVRVIAPIPWTQSLRLQTGPSECGQTFHPLYFYPPKIVRHQYHRFYWWSIRALLDRLASSFSPDLVMGYWLHPDGAAAVRAAQHLRAPCAVMSGGTDLKWLPGNARRRRALVRVIHQAARLIVFSRDLAREAHRLGVHPDKVQVVYRGVDRKYFHPTNQAESRGACGLPADGVIVLWAGRFEPVKNPALLLRAAIRWRREWGSRLCVIMAGSGSLQRQMQQLRKRMDLQDTVRFVGDVTQNELARYFNAADVTVVTSHSEGIPNVLLESIACGTPFVATDVGGIAEIACSNTDRLVPAGDAEALAESVIERVESGSVERRGFVPPDLATMTSQLIGEQAAGRHFTAPIGAPFAESVATTSFISQG